MQRKKLSDEAVIFIKFLSAATIRVMVFFKKAPSFVPHFPPNQHVAPKQGEEAKELHDGLKQTLDLRPVNPPTTASAPFPFVSITFACAIPTSKAALAHECLSELGARYPPPNAAEESGYHGADGDELIVSATIHHLRREVQ